MATLADALPRTNPAATAVIIPATKETNPEPLTLTFEQLQGRCEALQRSLASLGIGHDSAVSIALPNGLELIVRFGICRVFPMITDFGRRPHFWPCLGKEREWDSHDGRSANGDRIAAPLNSGYKQSEFEFYIQDLQSVLILVPKGDYAKNSEAVKAGKAFHSGIAECYWDGQEVVVDVKEKGRFLEKLSPQPILSPQPEDVALVLHTSGTTGRPKAVPLTHKNLTTTMST
jgi:acyl-CoA synthetase (AMP-forming)/AMP-acid ligase II